MKLLDEVMPDEVLLAPTCGPWSRMQNLNARTREQQHELMLVRDKHHRIHLKFCRDIYMKQVQEGRHAHLEQPTTALSWFTVALKKLPGHQSRFHQCAYGAMCKDVDGIWKPAKKDTTILTTKNAVAAAMNLFCSRDHEHCQLEGYLKGWGQCRTTFMENYQPSMAAILAAAIASPEPPKNWELAMVSQEARQQQGVIVQLMSGNLAEATRVVQRLHRNLGHPSPKNLADLLKDRGASDMVVDVAKTYVCDACAKYKKPHQSSPASYKSAEHFNQMVQADVFWIKGANHKYPILAVIDVATRFQAAAVIHHEKSADFIAAMERCWLQHFGKMETLITDEGRGWLSEEFLQWSDDNYIKHMVAPGEAHTRLSIVERRHAVLRKAIEIFLQDMKLDGPEGIRQALSYVLPQLNSQPNVAGYSPCQWVLGYQPATPGMLTSEEITPGHLDGHARFEDTLLKRNAARTAIMHAESDRKLRRALLRRYAGSNKPLEIGQECFYWRDAQASDLVKIRWKGPARVVLKEVDDDGVPTVYWIAHKTQLLRCAPHHVRGDLTSSSETAVENLKIASDTLKSLKSRGVTRYIDLNKANKREIDDVEIDEEDFESDAGEQESKRRRLDFLDNPPGPPGDENDMDNYEPSTPRELREQAEHLENQVPPDAEPPSEPAAPTTSTPMAVEELPAVPEDDASAHETVQSETVHEPEPSPSARNEPEPPPSVRLDPEPPPELDPVTAERFATPSVPEDFGQRRLRLDRQETLSFGPQRRGLSSTTAATPYSRKEPEDIVSHAFVVEDVDNTKLPAGWKFNAETGYFELNSQTPRDFWEIKNGCLIRHHVQQRRGLFDPSNLKDIPVPVDRLDALRVTLYRDASGDPHSFTDNFITKQAARKDGDRVPLPPKWTGMTVFQINAETRKEMGMFASGRQVNMTAKKVVQAAKVQEKRYVRKEKNKGEVSERNLTEEERHLFYLAKVKELKSFFECGVWEFSTDKEADAARTLTSRILLKWAKNPDGSPRAKARLVVRGYNDVDALRGDLTTASPTTSRLGRSLILSLSAVLRWVGWSADVATAFLQGLPQERKLWLKLPADAVAILGGNASTRMFLRKPVYGQLDAPRRWYLEAVRRLKSLNWRQHELDPCIFMHYKTEPDDSGKLILNGILCLHVDDMLGAGDRDCHEYVEAEKELKEAFEFRTWQTDSEPMEYCGASLKRQDYAWIVEHEQYVKKVKPVTVHRGRSPEDEMNDHDRSQLRALLGSLQWPAVQSSPHLQCSASLISGMMSTNKIRAIVEANSLLRFAKDNCDVGLRYDPFETTNLSDLRMTVMFDAAFGVREDGSSQGGYLMLLTPKKVFQEETPYHVLDWKSFKLHRVARSSLSAEAQAFGQATDAAEYACRFWACIMDPDMSLKEQLNQTSPLEPTVVTDAKALYDSYYKEGAGSVSQSVDKRTGLEIKVAKEQLMSLSGTLRWISSERQFADGLTKASARALLAERLRYGKIKFVWDPSYTAAKKKDRHAREESRNEFAESKVTKRKKDSTTRTTQTFKTSPHTTTTEMEWQESEQKTSAFTGIARAAMSAFAFMSQIKVSAAEDVAKNDLVPVNDLVHKPEATLEYVMTSTNVMENFWYYVLGFILFLFAMIAYVAYQFGCKAGEKKRMALVAECHEAHGKVVNLQLDALKEMEQRHKLKEQLLTVEQDLEWAKEEMATMRYDFRLAQGLISRAYEEITEHHERCHVDSGVWFAPHGEVWHLTSECPGLQQARQIQDRRCCAFCATFLTTPLLVNAMTGTSLKDDCEQFFNAHGRVGYVESALL